MGILNYKITSENTNTFNFLKFLKEIILNKRKKYIIILDNFWLHKAEEIINFFNENKINILFTSTYQSIFNPIELAFKPLKTSLIKKYIMKWMKLQKI